MTICTFTKYATTLFRFITLFCGTHSIPQNIPGYSHIQSLSVEIFGNISWNTVSPTVHTVMDLQYVAADRGEYDTNLIISIGS